MPKVRANNITINYDQQGTGEPLILIPYLAADYACYAFQVAEYAKHFTCISIDLRGTGESDKPEGAYSTEIAAKKPGTMLVNGHVKSTKPASAFASAPAPHQRCTCAGQIPSSWHKSQIPKDL